MEQDIIPMRKAEGNSASWPEEIGETPENVVGWTAYLVRASEAVYEALDAGSRKKELSVEDRKGYNLISKLEIDSTGLQEVAMSLEGNIEDGKIDGLDSFLKMNPSVRDCVSMTAIKMAEKRGMTDLGKGTIQIKKGVYHAAGLGGEGYQIYTTPGRIIIVTNSRLGIIQAIEGAGDYALGKVLDSERNMGKAKKLAEFYCRMIGKEPKFIE